MKDGFIKVAAATPDVRVADCEYNATEIIRMIHEMEAQGAKIMVFPELCITAYTCGDLFWQENLLEEAKVQLVRIAEETKEVDALIFVGLPLEYNGKLYNVAAGLNHGEILGFVPKTWLPNYNEFYEARYFTSGEHVDGTVHIDREAYKERYDSDFDDVEFDIEMTSFDEFEELEEIDDEDFGGETFLMMTRWMMNFMRRISGFLRIRSLHAKTCRNCRLQQKSVKISGYRIRRALHMHFTVRI